MTVLLYGRLQRKSSSDSRCRRNCLGIRRGRDVLQGIAGLTGPGQGPRAGQCRGDEMRTCRVFPLKIPWPVRHPQIRVAPEPGPSRRSRHAVSTSVGKCRIRGEVRWKWCGFAIHAFCSVFCRPCPRAWASSSTNMRVVSESNQMPTTSRQSSLVARDISASPVTNMYTHVHTQPHALSESD